MSSSLISSSVNPNNYDPISNLEKQYQTPLGKRIALIVKLNNACLVPGGVEFVLKHERGKTPGSSTNAAMEVALENSINDFDKLDIAGPNSSNQNPFGFLSDSSESNVRAASSSRSGKSKFASFGAKLKNKFDRGVTSIAVQAQKAAGDSTEIRDLLTVGAYIQDESGEFSVCLGMTERFDMPVRDEVDPDGDGLTFRIPIIIPFDVTSMDSGSVVRFVLWIRSGAAIFAKNRALRKYVFVGSSTLRLAQLGTHGQKNMEHPVITTMPLQSTVAPSGEITLIQIPDTKFPSLCGNGWSLSDPRTDSAYSPCTGKRMLFNPPLDQNYAFELLNERSRSPSSTILTTERLTESTVVLPLATAYTQLVAKAAAISTNHANDLATMQGLLDSSDTVNPMTAMQLGHAQCQIEVLHFLRFAAIGGGNIHVTLNLQRPDSIFENCIASSRTVPSHTYVKNTRYPPHASLTVPFYPRIVNKNDTRLLPGQTSGLTASNREVFVGKLRIQLYEEGVGGAGGDIFSPIGPAGSVGTNPRILEAVVDLDSYVNAKDDKGVVHLNVINLETGERAGYLAVTVIAHTLEGMVEKSNGISGSSESTKVNGGLISLVGMDTLMEDDKACYPFSDLSDYSMAKVKETERNGNLRQRQLATMGEFLTFDYLNRHAEVDRAKESKDFLEKCTKYLHTLKSPLSNEEEDLKPDKQKDPRPFRPSSSRMNPLLSSIGFNVHVQNFSVSTVSSDRSGAATIVPTALFQNVTCGAPADHYRGFSRKDSNDGEKGFSGGLRRLEASRVATADLVRKCQDNLIGALSKYYRMNSQSRQIPGRSVRHIPTNEIELASLRAACISATETLHSLTWDCAVRRANSFSQALGIALTLFLSHVSDLAKLQKAAWAELWAKHGFLITFEGLLSAAGKELGMIEDACVGISMLRMASIIFVTETNQVNPEKDDGRCDIIDSPYLRWVRITPSGTGSSTRYVVEVCVDANYYAQRIPIALRNQAEIRLYPILYQMGVDIRQWGANAGANAFGKSKKETQEEIDEDEIGIPDNDVLIALNYEAFRKMNAYAHEVFLVTDPHKRVKVTWEEAHDAQQIQQPIHPFLTALYEYIRSSAGKMEHGILDEAGFASNRLGGGSAIFCKSGKDRTAMQVTFKQAQYINRYRNSNGNGFAECEISSKVMYKDATTMRVYGTRLPICDKNVGQPLYAFNSLQAKFMPDMLKPPHRALAGFLKGGRVFTGEGIES